MARAVAPPRWRLAAASRGEPAAVALGPAPTQATATGGAEPRRGARTRTRPRPPGPKSVTCPTQTTAGRKSFPRHASARDHAARRGFMADGSDRGADQRHWGMRGRTRADARLRRTSPRQTRTGRDGSRRSTARRCAERSERPDTRAIRRESDQPWCAAKRTTSLRRADGVDHGVAASTAARIASMVVLGSSADDAGVGVAVPPISTLGSLDT